MPQHSPAAFQELPICSLSVSEHSKMAGRILYADEITSAIDSRRCFPQLHGHVEDFLGSEASTSESSRRWRKATLVLNATRRFPLQSRVRTRFRVCAHTICAVGRFQRGISKVQPSALASDGYGVRVSDLSQLLQNRQLEDVDKLGGVEGLAKSLHADTKYGLDETEDEMHKRGAAYGVTTYPKKVTKDFWYYVWDACKDTTLNILMACKDTTLNILMACIDTTLNILMACAVVSLATRIWTKGIKEGWYEGTSIGFAVLLLIVVTAVSDYKQRLNFQNQPFLTWGIKLGMDSRAVTEDGLVVEGKEFRTWDDAMLNSNALDNLVVMARSSPLDKLRLVKALKEIRGDVVAVTGDGTNDAPALKEADIGLSVGIAGTEVAKESSDIIILDDNFTSVVNVVRWGRSVYANIQNFIQFQLTVNVVALTINFVAAVSSGEVALTAVQLLWANLIMDTMGALALATAAPTDDLMHKTPIRRKEPLITNIMWRNNFGQAFFQITVLLILTYSGIEILGLSGTHVEQVRQRNIIIFNAFVFCQHFNEIYARCPEKFNVFEAIHWNYLFLGIIVTFPNDIADTTMLAINWWALCIAIGSVALPSLAALIRRCLVPKRPILEIKCFLGLKIRSKAKYLSINSASQMMRRVGISINAKRWLPMTAMLVSASSLVGATSESSEGGEFSDSGWWSVDMQQYSTLKHDFAISATVILVISTLIYWGWSWLQAEVDPILQALVSDPDTNTRVRQHEIMEEF